MERGKNSRNKKKAKARNALILYADESSFKLLPNLIKSYFPKGSIPIMEFKLIRKALNVISAISSCGQLIYKIRPSGFLGVHMADFLRQILKSFHRRNIILIWDGASAHRSMEVKELLRTLEPNRLELYQIPSHSPELNPDEQVWKYLKAESTLRNLACKSFKELREHLVREIENLKHDPLRIKKMFRHPNCAFY